MKNILDDKVMKQQEDSNMEASALKAALQKLIDLPGGPLDDIPAPEQQPQQMAQAQPMPGQEPAPEEGQQPPAEQPMPEQQQPPVPQQGGGLFAGFKTRQQQLDDELKKQMGQ